MLTNANVYNPLTRNNTNVNGPIIGHFSNTTRLPVMGSQLVTLCVDPTHNSSLPTSVLPEAYSVLRIF